MPKALLALLFALALTAAVVTAVVLSRSPEEPDRESPTYESTPLTDYDTAGVGVVRDSFCAAVPEEAVEEALGVAPVSSTAYDNGDRARLGDGLRDVAHEFGCGWTAPGTVVRAWVFAPPVTPRSARELARSAREEPGCQPVAEAPDFGKRTAALVCEDGDRQEASYRGLFGDAWLTCTLTAGSGVPRPELVDRAGSWCVAVLEAARTR